MITDAMGKGLVVAVYFSAHWCPPCKKFTPILTEFYKQANASGKVLEIIFCSSDKSEGEFNNYAASMPWISLPWNKKSEGDGLASKLGVRGIPALFVMNGDLSSCNPKGRNDVTGGKTPGEVVKVWKG